jgi:ubiquinone/menaquinone biosynthesis C-methylase UbiE
MKVKSAAVVLFFVSSEHVAAFSNLMWNRKERSTAPKQSILSPLYSIRSSSADQLERVERKKELLNILLGNRKPDPILADPITKEPVTIEWQGPLLSDGRTELEIRSSTHRYAGSTTTYLNLLTPIDENITEDKDWTSPSSAIAQLLSRQLAPFIPPPLRSAIAMTGFDSEYIPMRDLFTSPSVSFAYERGWRQGFGQAGFPGVDREFEMAREYFAPVFTNALTSTPSTSSTDHQDDSTVVVDMSCATGLFARRFAADDTYDRVLACDYSESMLLEARRRIQAEQSLKSLTTTRLELIRLDVGQLPFQSNSIPALHAGAAMHCWPDLDAAISEIYRVLKPGGRYFATTFLSKYFSNLQTVDTSESPSQKVFQYFTSTDTLRDLLQRNGFSPEKVTIDVLGNACVVIRCEK